MSISDRGKFITFEGIDGCGKSTQVKLLVEKLNGEGQKSILVREPGGTLVSEEIRDILLHRPASDLCDRTEALLMCGSRAQLTYEVILPNIESGLNVVADRYADSTLAYQGGGRKLDLDWLIQLNTFATFGLEPDVSFFVDVLPTEAERRRKNIKDRIERAGLELQSAVRNAYLSLVRRFPERIVVLDGHQSVEAIHVAVQEELKRRKLFK